MGFSGRFSVRGRWQRLHVGVAFASLATLGSFAILAPAAVADQVICGIGTGAGDCSSPPAVAVDRDEELVYVADNGNRRVDVFDASGTFVRAFGWNVAPDGSPGDTVADSLEVCTTTCHAGSSGSGPGQFASLNGIAVDNDSTSSSFHDIYVIDGGNHRIQKFDPAGNFLLAFGTEGSGPGQFNSMDGIGVGPGGTIYVVDTKLIGGCEVPEIGGNEVTKRVQQFSSAGVLIQQIMPTDAPCGSVQAFAVDSTGTFYIASAGTSGAVRKYGPSGAPLDTFHSSFGIGALGVDSDDNLFVGDNTEAATSMYQYDSAGPLFKVFYGDGTLQARPISFAPNQTETDLFVAETASGGLGRIVHIDFPLPGPVVHPDPTLTKADPYGNTWATLNARVNPEGKASTYHFEYVDDATYQAEGFSGSESTPEEAVALSDDPVVEPLFALGQASTQIGCPKPTKALLEEGKCLTPETVYHFRVVTSNGDGGPRIGPESTIETKAPFEILATWSSEVGADAARLNAEVNPLNIPTSGHFEYVEEAAYQADVKAGGEGFKEASATGEIDFGSAEEPAIRSVVLHGLEPGTVYRYRIVIEDIFGFKGISAVQSLRIFPLVSGKPSCPNDALRSGSSASLPDCRAYEMVSPIEKGGGEIAEGGLTLHDGGGLTQGAAVVPQEGMGFTYSSLRAFAGEVISSPFVSQYIATRHPLGSPDQGWTSRSVSPPREGAAFNGAFFRVSQYKAFSEDLVSGWLRNDSEPPLSEDSIPGFPNLYRRDNTANSYEAICPAKPQSVKSADFSLELQGFSETEGFAVFRANARLLVKAGPSNKERFQLYGCAGGEPQLVSVLPPALGGQANPRESSAGTRYSTTGDYTEDSLHNAISEDGSRIYWTDSEVNPAGTGPGRINLRQNPFAEGGECAGEGAPCTVPVSEAVESPGADKKAHFWTASPDGSVAIFSFTEGPLTDNLYEFDAETQTAQLIAEGVSGVAGFSEDAKQLYLTSTEALEGTSGAMEGEANLYLYEAGEGGGFTLVSPLPEPADPGSDSCALDAKIPYGRCSRATADGSRLAFVTDSRIGDYDNTDVASGKPDSEVYLYDATANGGEGELRCISCNPSGARPVGRARNASATASWVASAIPGWESSFYAPRALSDDGRRLFFESFDALVLNDTNGAQDVYQWEEAGSQKECQEKGGGLFVQSAGGCIDLISSGTDPYDSEFLDASADGSDVFFKTESSLVPQDPGLGDVYDARVGGGFPPPAPPVPSCEGDACQSQPPPPQASTPSSSVFQGPKAKSKARCPKGKHRVRKPGKKPYCAKKSGGSKKKRGQGERRAER